jgi:bla regulator protein BlaR1
MSFAGTLAAWLFAATWKGTLLVVLVLALHHFGRGRIAPRWLHALLLVAFVRLLVPVAPGAPFSLFNLLPSRTPMAMPLRAIKTRQPPAFGLVREARPSLPPSTRRVAGLGPLALSLLALWAGGMLVVVSRAVLRTRALRRRLARGVAIDATTHPAVIRLLDECRDALHVRRRVRLSATDAVGSPSLYGWLRPVLLLPAGLVESFPPEQLRHVLLHELAHLRRSDVLVNWIITAAHALHWFNPLVRLAVSRLAEERELACDALALEHLRDHERAAYGGTVLQLLDRLRASSPVPALVGMTANPQQLKRRILMIAKFRKPSPFSALFGLLVCAAALVTLTDARGGESLQLKRRTGPPLTPAAQAAMDRLDQLVTLDLQSASVEDVLHAVANTTGAVIAQPEGVLDAAMRETRFTIKAKNVPAMMVVAETLAPLGAGFRFTDAGLELTRQEGMRMRVPMPDRQAEGMAAFEGVVPADRMVLEEEPGQPAPVMTRQAGMKQEAGRAASPVEFSDEMTSDGATRRKVTIRGGSEGQPDGTLELEVRRAGRSPSR